MLGKLYFHVLKVKISKIIPFCMLLFTVSSNSSMLPASIDKVETYRINDFLVRVIKHNMEVNPILEIDKIITPEFCVIDSIKINSVTVANEELSFNESSGVFVESISSKHNEILFSLEYFYLEGGSNYIDCAISFNDNSITTPKCSYKDSVSSE
ncbi:hypothetical protein [Thaumasiovibrio sp. DFM-14]|uniref:hypothetical protein n=1 Tax=Thaumasiovibrio sp. DFM-14 TaxID=3384792 RepID=UPI0039A234B1